MRMGISGSRRWSAAQKHIVIRAVTQACRHYDVAESDIVVGCCPTGVDGIVREEFPGHDLKSADWERFEDPAGPIRNQEIIDAVGLLLAFPLSGSIGTYDTIRRAHRKGIPVWMVSPDGKIRRDIAGEKKTRPIILPDGSILSPGQSADFTTPEWAARRKAVEAACTQMSAERNAKGKDGADALAETKANAGDLFEQQEAAPAIPPEPVGRALPVAMAVRAVGAGKAGG